MKIEFVHSEDVIEFLREEIALDLQGQDLHRPDRWLFVVARNEHGAVVGAMVFEWKTPFDAHLSMAVVDHRCLLIAKLQTMVWEAVFDRAVRVSIQIDPENAPLEATVRRLGFVYEGFLRRGLDGLRDALLFGMLREDCRWLRARPEPRQAAPVENFGPIDEVRIH